MFMYLISQQLAKESNQYVSSSLRQNSRFSLKEFRTAETLIYEETACKKT